MPKKITIQPRKKCPNEMTREYLSQFDSHVHSFSHCVSVSRQDVPWDDKITGLEFRLQFIRHSLSLIYETAKSKGIRVQVITEHPQFQRYNIPFERYTSVLNEVRARFKDSFAALPFGLEVELKRDEAGAVYIDWDEISDGLMDPMEMVRRTDVLVFSMHHKQYSSKASEIKDSGDFVKAVKEGLGRISEFKEDIRRRHFKEKVCILGHPWDVACHTNRKAWEKNPEAAGKYSNFKDYESSSEAQVPFLETRELRELSDALLSAGVYPEINAHSIEEGRSDIRKGDIPEQNIAQAYIDYCIEKKKVPIISVGTDDHKIKGVGNLQLDLVLAKVESICRAVMWCELFQ